MRGPTLSTLGALMNDETFARVCAAADRIREARAKLILHTTCLMSYLDRDRDMRVSLNEDAFGVYHVMVERDAQRDDRLVPTEWCPTSVDAQFPELADAVRHMATVIERLVAEGGA